ncbi:MAG: hypothetical protein EBT62_08915 [Opitutaceae bacterium]|nr:hypothetical protein [Opitutaceae bacterium]
MVLGGASTAVGGAVNYVTIKPTAVQSNTVGLTVSDLGLTRLVINNMGPLYEASDFKALYRVTLGTLSADRDKEIENEKEKFAGGALALYFGPNTSVDLTAFARTDVLAFAGALSLAAIVGKQICSLGVLDKGADKLAVGLGMIPRGEVGLIFASIGRTLHIGGERVIDDMVYSAIVVMVAVTTLVTPPLLVWRLKRPTRS